MVIRSNKNNYFDTGVSPKVGDFELWISKVDFHGYHRSWKIANGLYSILFVFVALKRKDSLCWIMHEVHSIVMHISSGA